MKRIVHTQFFPALMFLLMIVAMGTVSCKKNTYYKLSDEDMSWLVYKDKEVVRFSNGLGQIQSFICAIRQKGYDVDGNTYAEKTFASFVQQNDTSHYAQDVRGMLYIGTGENGLYVTFTWPHFPIRDFPLHATPQQIMTLGGVNYSDIIVIDGSLLTDARRYIKIVYYSKSLGVVQYEDTFGNVWNKSI